MPGLRDILAFTSVWGAIGLLGGALFALSQGGTLWPLTGVLTGFCTAVIAVLTLGSFWLMKRLRLF